MDALDGMIAVGGFAFLLIAAGIYFLFSTGALERSGSTGGFMEALEPGLEDAGYAVLEVRDYRDARAIVMEDDQAKFIFACRKDPTQTLADGNETKMYDGEIVKRTAFFEGRGSLILSSFFEEGYLCFVGSRSGRARKGVSELREIIEDYGTVMED